MSPNTTQNVVIVGGGPAGVNTFQALAATGKFSTGSQKNLILVTSRSYFTHLPATLRTVVTSEGKLEDQVFIPFPDSFNTGNKKVVYGKVTSVVDDNTKGRYVTLDNGETIEYTALLLSPGSIWDGPVAFPEQIERPLEWINTWRNRFEKANDIVLVGGGAVGVELAGELRDSYPKKSVTIIHGQQAILNSTYPEKWRRQIKAKLEKRGVRLVLGDVLEDFEPKDGSVTTRSGKKIPADLVVPVRGPKPNTKFIESLGSDVLTASGEVKVKPTLQLVNHPRIFAAGDAIQWDEQKAAAKAGMGHAAIVAKNIISLLDDKPLKDYKGSYEMIALTIGKAGGSTYLGILWGIIFGDWFTSLMKSKSLLIDMTRKGLA